MAANDVNEYLKGYENNPLPMRGHQEEVLAEIRTLIHEDKLTALKAKLGAAPLSPAAFDAIVLHTIAPRNGAANFDITIGGVKEQLLAVAESDLNNVRSAGRQGLIMILNKLSLLFTVASTLTGYAEIISEKVEKEYGADTLQVILLSLSMALDIGSALTKSYMVRHKKNLLYHALRDQYGSQRGFHAPWWKPEYCLSILGATIGGTLLGTSYIKSIPRTTSLFLRTIAAPISQIFSSVSNELNDGPTKERIEQVEREMKIV